MRRSGGLTTHSVHGGDPIFNVTRHRRFWGIRFIKHLQVIGFSLDDVSGVLAKGGQGHRDLQRNQPRNQQQTCI